jgi:uncharacterized protein (TIGR02678 family)
MTAPRRGRALLDRPVDATDQRLAAEQRRAMRALLSRPLLHATGPQDSERLVEELRLVRRHRAALTKEFTDGLRYRLIVEPGGARLVKSGLGRDGSRPLRRPTKGTGPGRPFTPRDYAVLTVTLAVLSRSAQQLLLGELAGEIRSAAATVGINLDLESITDRRLVHAVLLVLTEWGVLTERDGDLEQWADNVAAQSLLEISAERLALLLTVPMPTGRGDAEILDPPPLTPSAGGARIAIRRMLVESPVLTTEDLPPEYQEWWARSRGAQAEWFERALGLHLELRAEGALITDPDEELTDEVFPGPGSLRHAALMALDVLVSSIRPQTRSGSGRPPAWWPVSEGAFRAAIDQVLTGHAKALRKSVRENPAGTMTDIAGLLTGMGLLRPARGDSNGTDQGTGDADDGMSTTGWELHAAAARYAVTVSHRSQADASSPSPLFDLEGEGSA